MRRVPMYAAVLFFTATILGCGAKETIRGLSAENTILKSRIDQLEFELATEKDQVGTLKQKQELKETDLITQLRNEKVELAREIDDLKQESISRERLAELVRTTPEYNSHKWVYAFALAMFGNIAIPVMIYFQSIGTRRLAANSLVIDNSAEGR